MYMYIYILYMYNISPVSKLISPAIPPAFCDLGTLREHALQHRHRRWLTSLVWMR